MEKNKYLLYHEYLKGRNINGKTILLSKTNDSYIIGPKIDECFDEKSFS